MNGAKLLVAALENEGVKQIFGAPGEENLDRRQSMRWRLIVRAGTGESAPWLMTANLR
jgi:thiamine pyrophosphate-dependent acetolactate synthase large subunit-like protein